MPLEETIETNENTFDYEKLREETTKVAMRDMLRVIGENADILIHNNNAETAEIKENYDTVMENMLVKMVENKVPLKDMQYIAENLQSTIYILLSSVKTLYDRTENELLARTIEARNPGDQHFSKEYATFEDLFKAVDRKREEQKDDEFGFFYT